MLNHGLSTGMLFLCVGLLYERAHTRFIDDFGGVSRRMPVFAGLFLIAILSSLGLPGLNGFIGEILCLFGVFTANKIWAIMAVTTVIVAAAYLLGMFQRVMHGPVKNDRIAGFKDLSLRELAVLIPIVFLMFWIGLFPGTFLRKMEATVAGYISSVKNRESIFVRERTPASIDSGSRTSRPADGRIHPENPRGNR